ncbi:hypothetical protein A2331_01990 [Candidatus Falkowbacteria bacterium RIFOXYB2_FULL_34_18]|uniref:Uncharacterized protein n=1 Tax=Candidatus Falkowbacteria bacterium RIFOXYD2_FULL_34_120 TaxID=1798007 RepID=A0A1F5TQG1_9BACT|nr:MAG: hypothetical protein A2331_01990 [Candidatus Falkowbacteria bacterium RIFOXYB2_FULL_34_18]OGF29451.1 MAG: hypothetical protein A2500_01050 [Candidatus Falkowbacteria bacterium RIFOXYC12_FULL_34_55]OGF36764.1 MAG: hypothetical protein A2466_03360 [Candidatus Falkowbacteria bacterium RIFOXYC2_FULL_34_220]OGF38977.1 MAG: hypothetical protein A2515_05475 [Candidatus Falkowbacteria bacterium RIFOXYD12_FULL_34_57]OGF41170.1 MAG: hypothetical protein A2531_01480 [Candidatus Falkowbacteria bact
MFELKNILKIFLVFTFLLIVNVQFCFALNLSDAFKANDGTDTDPLDAAAKSAGYNIQQTTTIEDTIASVINTILSFLGVIFLLLIMYGGYTWMMARGNEQEVEKAKNTIKTATIGLVVIVGAYAFSWFILQNLGESTLQK